MSTSNSRARVSQKPNCIGTLIVSLVLLSGSASAANLTVICPGGGAGAYPSISAALSTLDPHGPNSITVSGTCVENVDVDRQQNLFIFGTPATISAADPSSPVLVVFDSPGLILSGLVFQGGSTGVTLGQSNPVNMFDCTIQKNSGDGMDVQGSNLDVENSVFQDNQGNGLLVGGSVVTLGTTPNQRTRVLRNGGDGIFADASYLGANFGVLDVEDNAGAAIDQFGGRLLIFGPAGVGPGNVLQGNGLGIAVSRAGSADFIGRNVVRNNGNVGVQILASSVQFSGGGTLPDGTPNATVIEGHASAGVVLSHGGELTFDGPHQIASNGGAGFSVERSSLSLQNGVSVSNNAGGGILGDAHSGLVLGPSVSVTSNTSTGIRLKHQSLVGFTAPVTVQGNGGGNVACDATSLAYGQLAGITGVKCEQ